MYSYIHVWPKNSPHVCVEYVHTYLSLVRILAMCVIKLMYVANDVHMIAQVYIVTTYIASILLLYIPRNLYSSQQTNKIQDVSFLLVIFN